MAVRPSALGSHAGISTPLSTYAFREHNRSSPSRTRLQSGYAHPHPVSPIAASWAQSGSGRAPAVSSTAGTRAGPVARSPGPAAASPQTFSGSSVSVLPASGSPQHSSVQQSQAASPIVVEAARVVRLNRTESSSGIEGGRVIASSPVGKAGLDRLVESASSFVLTQPDEVISSAPLLEHIEAMIQNAINSQEMSRVPSITMEQLEEKLEALVESLNCKHGESAELQKVADGFNLNIKDLKDTLEPVLKLCHDCEVKIKTIAGELESHKSSIEKRLQDFDRRLEAGTIGVSASAQIVNDLAVTCQTFEDRLQKVVQDAAAADQRLKAAQVDLQPQVLAADTKGLDDSIRHLMIRVEKLEGKQAVAASPVLDPANLEQLTKLVQDEVARISNEQLKVILNEAGSSSGNLSLLSALTEQVHDLAGQLQAEIATRQELDDRLQRHYSYFSRQDERTGDLEGGN